LIYNRIINDGFGRRYKLHLFGDGPVSKHLKPKSFYDEALTIKFLQGVDVNDSYWRQLSYKLVGNLPYTANSLDYLEAIARLLIQRRILVFDINKSNTKQYSLQDRSFKETDGTRYRIILPVDKLIDPAKKTKKFRSKKEAVDFVKKLGSERNDLQSFRRDFNLSPMGQKNEDQDELYASIADALFDESLLVFVEEPFRPPASELEYEDVYIQPTRLLPSTKLSEDDELVKPVEEPFFFSI